MSNMSYCRFRNTLADLQDCYESMGDPSQLTEEEQRAAERLVKLCQRIVADFGEVDEDDED